MENRHDGFHLTVTIPANTTATVCLPTADAAHITEGGHPAVKAAGVKFLRVEANGSLLEVGSGTYHFTVLK